jgi:heat shock protein HslJ
MIKLLCLIGICLTVAVGCASKGANTSAGPSDGSALVGRPWTLVSLQGNAIVAQRPPTLQFDQQGGVTAFGGINRISGAYTRQGQSSLAFGQLASTRMAGDPTLMRMEHTFLNALQSVDGYKLTGDELTLTSKDVVVASFRAADRARA